MTGHPIDDVPLLRTPEDLIRAVPYLLRFHPAESLVLIGLTEHRLVATARITLTDIATPEDLTDPGPLATTLTAMRHGGAVAVSAILYTDHPAAGARLPYAAVVAALDALAGNRGLRLSDALLTRRDRWWSYYCESPACCPPEGRPVLAEVTAWEAAMVAHGVAPVGSRDELAARLAPADSQVSPAALRRATRQGTATAEELLAAAATGDLDLTEAATWGAALRSIDVRDAVWLAAENDRLVNPHWWVRLGTMLPAPYCAAPFFLAGWDAWRAGDGAFGNVCIERVLSADPDYSAARLLDQVLRSGVNPHDIPRLQLS
jgi:hypothetical protein